MALIQARIEETHVWNIRARRYHSPKKFFNQLSLFHRGHFCEKGRCSLRQTNFRDHTENIDGSREIGGRAGNQNHFTIYECEDLLTDT
jgi:hypothetical protein